mmetsp:Transcript_41997/g.115922  ORF Transcript_41997/g.115922 Transcript_41997/m.115922 type:complete len:227 (+) Transcript_41997:174-854(+)
MNLTVFLVPKSTSLVLAAATFLTASRVVEATLLSTLIVLTRADKTCTSDFTSRILSSNTCTLASISQAVASCLCMTCTSKRFNSGRSTTSSSPLRRPADKSIHFIPGFTKEPDVLATDDTVLLCLVSLLPSGILRSPCKRLIRSAAATKALHTAVRIWARRIRWSARGKLLHTSMRARFVSTKISTCDTLLGMADPFNCGVSRRTSPAPHTSPLARTRPFTPAMPL